MYIEIMNDIHHNNGSASFGEDYKVIIITNIIHSWDEHLFSKVGMPIALLE